MADTHRFEVTDDKSANWAFQKLAEIKPKKDEMLKKYKVFIDQAEEWREKEIGKLNDREAYFQGMIESYRLTLPDKKVNVPAGQTIVSHRKKVEYEESDLIEFVKNNHPDYIRQEVNKADFKKIIKPSQDGKYVDEDGQIVKGMHYEKAETVTYKTN
ncbi:host-nuclease inhibitor Gam family protein [Latilactobacillus curvatus]|uniref:host-nuclease inhibitor Gam family protein n=1 Tax=Latilactobacillus curvatus TaxID=28038 RepID=UPI002D79A415|nr:host-nuclease inhibitor Gam family protein [Latilactobacillus curvatus]WRS47034.1 host-nuclease inhibitor Gam family protein [Latilactobacillus curvatus]